MPNRRAHAVISRRRFVQSAVAAGIAWQASGQLDAAKPASLGWRQFNEHAARRTPWQVQVDASLAKAAAWLVEHQADDGSWRSEEYGALRDGASLTPTVCTTLYYLPQGGRAAELAFARGRSFLFALVDEEGELLSQAYPFPIYSASVASWVSVLGDQPEHARRAQRAWIRFLRERQFSRELGWDLADPRYGGWGYTIRPPQKLAPETQAPLQDANISATLFALGALSNAQATLNDPAIQAARSFVIRCQNLSTDDNTSDGPASDGGFCFSPTDVARNKAGEIAADDDATPRFRSYGSATADGLRALLRCGFEPQHPRVAAAAEWLRRNFSTEHNPGDFSADRTWLRDSYYYYYCWSLTHAFMHLGQRPFVQQRQTGEQTIDWIKQMAAALMERQQDDGTWRNRFRDAKEDDPLISTPLAAAALAACRLAEGTAGERDPPG